MPIATRNTVDRLDKPSAYYLGKVEISYCPHLNASNLLMPLIEQETQIWSRRPGRTRENTGQPGKSAEGRYHPLCGKLVCRSLRLYKTSRASDLMLWL